MDLREKFEAWASEFPMEWEPDIFPDNSEWPGNYTYYPMQCAWDGFKEGHAQQSKVITLLAAEMLKLRQKQLEQVDADSALEVIDHLTARLEELEKANG